jgi:hypothetical protein
MHASCHVSNENCVAETMNAADPLFCIGMDPNPDYIVHVANETKSNFQVPIIYGRSQQRLTTAMRKTLRILSRGLAFVEYN